MQVLKVNEDNDEIQFIADHIVKEKKPYAMIGVSSGDGIDQFFKEIGISVIVKADKQ